jgi:hypothetical protein
MTQLTQAQIKILEAAFASYPSGYPMSPDGYNSMQGIQDQLDALDGQLGFIFYVSKCTYNEEENHFHYTMEKMIPGVQLEPKAQLNDVPQEPDDDQVRIRMENTGESYYTARENLREDTYGGMYSKPPGQSWGDFWKTY